MADIERDAAQDLEDERTRKAAQPEPPVRRGQQDADDDQQFDDEDDDLDLEDEDDEDADDTEGPQGAPPA